MIQPELTTDKAQTKRGRLIASAVLGFLVLAAGFVSLRGIDYLVPQVINRDGLVIVRQVELFRAHAEHPESVPYAGAYPLLLARILSLLPPRAVEPGRILDLAGHLEQAVAPWLEVRRFMLLLSLIAIPGTYLLARRFLDRGGAVLAAALIATSPLHLGMSIQEKPHGAATSFMLLALLAALRFRRRPDLFSYLLCGLALAFAVGTLLNGFACLFPLGVAFLLRERRAHRASSLWLGLWPALIVVVARSWYARPARVEYRDVGSRILAWVETLSSPDRLEFMRFPRLLAALWSNEPVLFLLGMLGIVGWLAGALRERGRLRSVVRGDFAIVLAFVLPYLLVIAFSEHTRMRYTLPLFPPLACAAAYAFSRGPARWLSKLGGSARVPCTIAAGAAVVAIPSALGWHVAEVRTRPDTLEEAARWVEEHVGPSETVVVSTYKDLPLLPTREAALENAKVPWSTGWTEYFARTPRESVAGTAYPILVLPGGWPEARQELRRDPMAYFARWGARYAVIDVSVSDPGIVRALARIEERAQKVARFTPFPEHGARFDGVESWSEMDTRLWPAAFSMWNLERFGPAVEIWRLP